MEVRKMYCGERSWVLRSHFVPGEPTALEFHEDSHVFAKGSGVVIWPAAAGLLEHLLQKGISGTLGMESHGKEDATDTSSLSLKGCRILELGCGCGLVAVCLARWGATVVAADFSTAALDLTEVNGVNLTDANDGDIEGSHMRIGWTSQMSMMKILIKEEGSHMTIE